MEAADINVGDKFSSFASLHNVIKRHGEKNHVIFIRKDSKKVLDPEILETLIYERVTFECKQGRVRKPQGCGVRPVQRSIKLGCKAKIKASLRCGDAGDRYLEITFINLEHDTHTPSEAVFSSFPERRKIKESAHIKNLLKFDSINNRDLALAIEEEQGIRPTMKEIQNMKRKFAKDFRDDDEEVNKILQDLCSAGGDAVLSFNDKNEFICLNFQTCQMKTLLSLYGDVLIMDVTYSTNVYKYPLLTVMCVDANGRGQPVLHSFLSSEEQAVLVNSLEFLKASFDFSRTSCFFVDKDFLEIGALSKVFPEVTPILCSFHISSAIKRALTNKGLSPSQADTARALFMQMKEEITEEGYSMYKEKLISILPSSVVDYFNDHWFNKPQHWAAHQLVDTVQLHVTTTNHCESYHQKIKQRLNNSMKLSCALQGLLKFDLDIANSSSFEDLRLMSTRSVDCGDSVITSIRNDVTPFAAALIIDQYVLMKKIAYDIQPHSDATDLFALSRLSTTHYASATTCSCVFFKNFSLPCRHIFFVRSHLSLPLYVCLPDEHRFKPRACLSHNIVPSRSTFNSSSLSSSSCTSTSEDKYKKVSSLFRKMASYLSPLGDRDFEKKYLCLSSLFNSWTSSHSDKEHLSTSALSSDPHTDAMPVAALPSDVASSDSCCVTPHSESFASRSLPSDPGHILSWTGAVSSTAFSASCDIVSVDSSSPVPVASCSHSSHTVPVALESINASSVPSQQISTSSTSSGEAKNLNNSTFIKPDPNEIQMEECLNETGLSSQQPSLPSNSSHDPKSLNAPIFIKPDPDEMASNQKISLPSPLKCEVKEEMMYCQFCSHSDVDFNRLKCHSLTQHPSRPAVLKFGVSKHDFKFFCVKETCNFYTTICTVYEEHLMNCCPLHQTLSGKEKERLKSTLQFVLDFHNKHCSGDATGCLEYFSSFNKTYTSEDDCAQLKKHKEHNDLFSFVSKPSTISDGPFSNVCDYVGERKLEGSLSPVPNPVPLFIVQNQNANLTESQTNISENNSTSVRKLIKNNGQLPKNCSSVLNISKSKIHTQMETQTGKRPFSSVECDKCFHFRSDFLTHLRKHTCEKPFKCNVCHKIFIRSSSLTLHKRTHTGEKPFKVCDKEYISSMGVIVHKRTHRGEKPFQCHVCNREFTSSSDLTGHKRTHTGEKPFKCDLCDKHFTSSTGVIVHKRIHTGEKPFKCRVCNKAFTRSGGLFDHKKTHTGEKPFKCSVCYKEFTTSSHLIVHKRSHTDERPFKCSECNKGFADSSNLTRHKRAHTGKKPFKCNVCQKEFTSSGDLTVHKRTHTGEKPYKCDMCDKKYKSSADLIVHKRTHTGEMPYKCNGCDKSFACSRSLRRHESTHSCNKPYTIDH